MKFYVKSHKLEVVVGGPHITNAEEAAIEAFLRHYKYGTTLAPLTVISKRGFDYLIHDHNEDTIMQTESILKKAGMIDEC